MISCGFGGPDKPKNLISKSDMVKILIDAKLIGSATITNKNAMEARGLKIESYVFEKYGIDSLQFAQSNNYYAYHLSEYEEIYTMVTDSLEKLKKDLKALEAKEEKELKKQKEDSINALKENDTLKSDTLKVDKKKELIKIKELKKKKLDENEAVLITPVSDKERQLHK
ncbi:DUF4296 domain-containing protein [Mariniflexile sp.]|uniref:DUF4296 domain-containing protein n=1 Tax=Mariniflexile sp. TaxID=1979402 RepID=UPI00356247F0